MEWKNWRDWIKSPLFKLIIGVVLLCSAISWENLHSLMALKMQLQHGVGFIGFWYIAQGLAYLYKYFGFFLEKKEE